MARKQLGSTPSPGEDEFRTREDAHDIMRYAQLRGNKDRHKRAMDMIGTAAALGDGDGDEEEASRSKKTRRGVARQGRRTMPRNIGRR